MKPGSGNRGWIEFACVALALAVAPLTAGAQQTEHHVLRGDRVAIHNLAGEVRLEAGSGPDVVVRITRGGADAARLSIRSGSIGGAETLRVLYPDDDVVYAALRGGRTTLSVSGDGTLGRGGRRVTIRGSGRGLHAHADLTIAIPAGKRVALHHGVGRIRVDGVSADLFVDAASAGIASKGTRGTLDLDTGSGSVKIEGAHGNLRVDTGSGAVTVEGVQGDRVLLDTGSGRVSGSNIDAAEVNVDTGSGSIDLAAVRADEVRLDTGSGGVRLELLSDIRLLDVDTGSGSVTVSIPDQLGAAIEMETGSGSIRFDIPIQVSRVERDHLIGRIGDGRGKIRIETGSGGIHLTRQ
ncbi:MAG: DUF4097 domain-containing protein [Gemmatimonadota bacterium]